MTQALLATAAPPAELDYAGYCQALRSRYADCPMHVHIETLGMCNARCGSCPNSVSPRRTAKMPDGLFAKIVRDLKQLPADRALGVSPFKLNEPLLDPKLFERMKTLARALPHAQLWLTSNFSLACEDRLRRLSEVPNLGYIWVSLHTLDAGEYRRWMGLDLERTVANVRRLLELNRAKRFVPRVVLGRVADGTDGDARFAWDAQRVFGEYRHGREYETQLLPRGQWMGHCEGSSLEIPEMPCARWFEISITCTGQVAFCCMDGLCKWPLGDVGRQSVLEIYRQPACQELRESLPPRRVVEPCVGCGFT